MKHRPPRLRNPLGAIMQNIKSYCSIAVCPKFRALSNCPRKLPKGDIREDITLLGLWGAGSLEEQSHRNTNQEMTVEEDLQHVAV